MVNTDKYKTTAPSEIEIKDEFIKKYLMLTGKQICKSGNMGSLMFYEDLTLPHMNFLVFKDDDMFELSMNEQELQQTNKGIFI